MLTAKKGNIIINYQVSLSIKESLLNLPFNFLELNYFLQLQNIYHVLTLKLSKIPIRFFINSSILLVPEGSKYSS